METSRVHGNKIIRRSKIDKEKNFPEFREQLLKDFQGICGYCAKDRRVFLEEFHIDHFAPTSKFPERKNKYSNLVFACPQCNRLKSNKWVTKDADISHTDTEGFVDPATEEYDEHLYRNENGQIVHKTSIGKYMCDTFKFDIRPISLIWKINKLEELERKLRGDYSYEGLFRHEQISIALKDILEDIRLVRKE